MRFLVLLLAVVRLHAAEFECARITKAAGSVVKDRTTIQTGNNSRAELTFDNGAIVRLGSNAWFECIPEYVEVFIDKGVLLYASPEDKASRHQKIIRAGPIAVAGVDFEVLSSARQIKVIGLNKYESPACREPEAGLRPGEMIVIPVPVESKVLPKTQVVKLEPLISTSKLMQMGPLPNQAVIEQNAAKQIPKASFKLGLNPDAYPADPSTFLAAQAQPASQIEANQAAVAAKLAAQQVSADQQIAQQRGLAPLAARQAEMAAAFAAQQAKEKQIAEAAAVAQQPANQGNQGNAFGPGGNAGGGNNGGNNGNQGQGQGGGKPANIPPGQAKK
jgi:hypothetical protein